MAARVLFFTPRPIFRPPSPSMEKVMRSDEYKDRVRQGVEALEKAQAAREDTREHD